jgi:hypothetical protein
MLTASAEWMIGGIGVGTTEVYICIWYIYTSVSDAQNECSDSMMLTYMPNFTFHDVISSTWPVCGEWEGILKGTVA